MYFQGSNQGVSTRWFNPFVGKTTPSKTAISLTQESCLLPTSGCPYAVFYMSILTGCVFMNFNANAGYQFTEMLNSKFL